MDLTSRLHPLLGHPLQGQFMFRTLLLTMMLSAFLISTGCASKTLSQNDSFDQAILEKATEFSGDSELALTEADVKYEAAMNADMNFYAPLHMAKAKAAFTIAREAELKGLQSDSIIASANVITLLELAEQNKVKVVDVLQPLLQQKMVLEQLNSPRVLPQQFKNCLADIKELITIIETEDEGISASSMDSVLVKLHQLELNTLLEIHLQPAKNTLAKAENENADTNAPKSFALAKQLVEQADKDIRAQYSDRALVSQQGLIALRSSQHALYIARDAEQLSQLNKQSAEEAVLRFESLLAQIGATLKAQDVRHMALQDQATALAQNAETQASRLIAPLQNRIAELEKRLNNVQNMEQSTQE